MVETASKSIKVLTIDDGGIRGIILAIILDELQRRLSQDLWQSFDLIAGTSTGGIVALGIGTRCHNGQPYSPRELIDLYVQNGPSIFKKGLVTREREIILPKYSPEALEAVLEQFFGATHFDTALTPLLISSYDLQSQLPFFFKSHQIAANPNYNWNVTDIARATSAAPTYFPPLHPVRGDEDYALIDGGVYVNNPAMAAYAEARSLYPDVDQVTVVSVGTGDRRDQIAYASAKDCGLLGWARAIVPVFMDGVSEAVDYELTALPNCTYYRLQVPDLQEASSDMDDVTPENLEDLQTVAQEYLSSVSDILDAVCTELRAGRGDNMSGTGQTRT